MDIVLERRDTAPDWIHSLLWEMGSLQFGPGFDHFLHDAELTFGVRSVRGIKAITGFFTDAATPLNIEHKLEEFWEGGQLKMLRGEALMAKRADPVHVIRPPFVHFIHLRDVSSNMISKLAVILGPVGMDGSG